ncbi:hypothetical protein DBR32_00645 [Taibaiella sp. KBW10]|uniref:hypothetical protein n=1 Tax=Taibaiella sp. KBW10 TaxID=2153357 RepID=UPI000F5AED2D|nr:hypothetical protein [Taibaiella sp. KBW10]RQO32155.1 hypothetical protein DBR32_00645 [Taibaiella sp. KBW10]
MKKILLIIFVFTQLTVYAQKIKDNFNVVIRTENGDLNKDGLIDKVVVTMDTINKSQPLRLQIFFLQPNGKYVLKVSTEKLIEPQYPNGQYCGNQIPDFEIEKGCLNMISTIKENHFIHKFKFNKQTFELQSISKVVWDGDNLTTETEFNLLTGKKTETVKALGSEKIVKRIITKIVVKPLPRIDHFSAYDSKLN